MKAGRPSYHVPAKWITVCSPNGFLFYELDSKGNITKNQNICSIPQVENSQNEKNKSDIKKKGKKKEEEENKDSILEQEISSDNIEKDDDYIHLFENELVSDCIDNQEENLFELMNFF